MSAAPKASETPFSQTWYFPSGAVKATAGSSTFHLLFLFVLASFVQAVTTCNAPKFLMENSFSTPTALCNQSYQKCRHSLSNVSLITTQAESAAKIAAFRPPPWPNLQNMSRRYKIKLSLIYATEFRSIFHEEDDDRDLLETMRSSVVEPFDFVYSLPWHDSWRIPSSVVGITPGHNIENEIGKVIEGASDKAKLAPHSVAHGPMCRSHAYGCVPSRAVLTDNPHYHYKHHPETLITDCADSCAHVVNSPDFGMICAHIDLSSDSLIILDRHNPISSYNSHGMTCFDAITVCQVCFPCKYQFNMSCCEQAMAFSSYLTYFDTLRFQTVLLVPLYNQIPHFLSSLR